MQQQPFFHSSSHFGVITPNTLAVGMSKQTYWGVFKYSTNLDVDVFVSDSASCPGEASGWWYNLQLEASGSLLNNVMHSNNPMWLMCRTTREEDNPSWIRIGKCFQLVPSKSQLAETEMGPQRKAESQLRGKIHYVAHG